MSPKYTAYRGSPHARVTCAGCHVGPGAGWYVQSKLSGLYQVYSVAFNKYPRPIPTPITNLRPARETCEQCHWPLALYGTKQSVRVQDIYLKNNFPEMKASWRTYPDHIGHYFSAGCYRCHDGKHQSADGRTISHDCNACHLIIEQGDGKTVNETNLAGLEFKHPVDIGEAWKEMSCHECHGLAAGM